MTPEEEAMQFIDALLATVPGTRADHAQVIQAVGIVNAALAKSIVPTSDEPSPKEDSPKEDSQKVKA